MSNGWQVFWTFAVWCIGRRMFLCTICALEHLCTDRQPNKHLCTNVWLIFRTSVCSPFVHKRLTDILERKGKENSMKIKKITLEENVNNYHRKKVKYCVVWYVGQQTVVQCFSAQTVAWAIYILLLSKHWRSVCCPKVFAV